jgi:uncharacterized protein (TIGR03067 family)
MKALFAALLTVAVSLSAPAADLEPGFKSLFNGRDLSGWEGNRKLWSVEDGAITGRTANEGETKIKHNTFLVWQGGEVRDFELRLQYRIVAGNSGIQYRSKLLPPGEFGPIVGGYQADFEAGKTYSGILYEERGRGILAQRGQKTVVKPEKEVEGKDGKKQRKADVQVTGSLGRSEDIQAKIKPEDWNDYVIIARGNHLQHFINGQQTVDVTDEDPKHAARSGLLALQIHVGPAMTVQFRNIRLKELGPSRADLDQMQGQWEPVEIIADGRALGREEIAHIKVSITGNRYSVETRDGQDGGSLTLDPAQQPRRMDITTQAGDHVPAIYEITGDTMRACYALGGAPRPDDFEAGSGSSRVLAKYRRVNR